MYRETGQWEDAVRVARSHGTRVEACALALEWALNVGPEIGGKLLVRNAMADECLSLACDREMVTKQFILININNSV